MGTNGGEGNLGNIDQSETDSAGLARRQMLKGAVAAGVGVVAWSSPNIRSIGGTPAYAQVCTAPVVTFEAGNRNTSCNCRDAGTNSPSYANYKELQNFCRPFDPVPFSVVLTDGPNGTPIDDSGTCAPGDVQQGNGTPGNTYATVGPNSQNLFCRARVQVTVGQCGNVQGEAFSAVLPPTGGSVPMPGVLCQGGGNLFTQVDMQCSVDPACLV